MTNWKFTAFFAITLMLVAGLFSSTAAASNGHGTMGVTAAATGDDFQGADENATPPLPQILFAGEEGHTLTFIYEATKDMDGGKVEITQLNRDDWTIPFNTTEEGDNITIAQTGGTTTPLYVKGSDATASTSDNELVEVTKKW